MIHISWYTFPILQVIILHIENSCHKTLYYLFRRMSYLNMWRSLFSRVSIFLYYKWSFLYYKWMMSLVSYTIYLNMRKVRFSYLNMRKLYTYRKLMPQNPLNRRFLFKYEKIHWEKLSHSTVPSENLTKNLEWQNLTWPINPIQLTHL